MPPPDPALLTPMLKWLIGISIVLQLLCVGVSGFFALKARNGSWRFWLALMVAFVGIVIRRSLWLLDANFLLDHRLSYGLSLGATYLVSLAFLAAMTEAAQFHFTQRGKIGALSTNIVELERRLEERARGHG